MVQEGKCKGGCASRCAASENRFVHVFPQTKCTVVKEQTADFHGKLGPESRENLSPFLNKRRNNEIPTETTTLPGCFRFRVCHGLTED